MVAVPLPPKPAPVEAAAVNETSVDRRAMAMAAFAAWRRKLWPAAETHLPADATVPGTADRRAALRLAAAPAACAALGLLPVLVTGHVNPFTAPPWALAAVFLAVLQWIYGAWMINVPDWASARVQMVVCAIITTIYGMVMTLTMIAPARRTLILGLDEVRRGAPAWCAIMLAVMGMATWFCGRASMQWKRRLEPGSDE